MKRLIAMGIAASVFLMPVVVSLAQEEGKAKAGGEKRKGGELKELTLTGKVTKEEKKEGEKTRTVYTLTTADGVKVRLPTPKPAKEGEQAINLNDFVDQDVTVVGKGNESEKEGKKSIHLVTITKIEKAAAAGGGAAAPAAPAEAK